MLPLIVCLWVDHNKKLPSFFTHWSEIRVLIDLRQFAIEKDGDFCFDQNQSNGNIFKVKKSHISLIHGGGRQGRQIGNVGSQSSIVYKKELC